MYRVPQLAPALHTKLTKQLSLLLLYIVAHSKEITPGADVHHGS